MDGTEVGQLVRGQVFNDYATGQLLNGDHVWVSMDQLVRLANLVLAAPVAQQDRIAELEAENAALLIANRDCIDHFNGLKAEYDAMLAAASAALLVAEWVNEEQGFQYLVSGRLPDGTKLYMQPAPVAQQMDVEFMCERLEAMNLQPCREAAAMFRQLVAAPLAQQEPATKYCPVCERPEVNKHDRDCPNDAPAALPAEPAPNTASSVGYVNDFPRKKLGADPALNSSAEQGERKPAAYGCHCHPGPDMAPDGCVIDEGFPERCVYARRVNVKEQCEYWRPIAITK